MASPVTAGPSAANTSSDPSDPLSEPVLKSLMLAALDGDAAAYRRLLTGLRVRLRSYFRRRMERDEGDAEDLVQDTLIAIHSRRATFDREQPLSAWVFAIARYKLIDHYRRKGHRRHVPIEDHEDLSVDDESAAVDARRDIERGLAALPDRARDLVRSVKLNEEPIADVAARTGLSEAAVKVAVHRGFRLLAAKLTGSDRKGGDE